MVDYACATVAGESFVTIGTCSGASNGSGVAWRARGIFQTVAGCHVQYCAQISYGFSGYGQHTRGCGLHQWTR